METPVAPSRLLALVHALGAVSRAEAARRLGLARSAVGYAAGALADHGLIVEGRPSEHSERGRPSLLLRPAPDGPVAVAVQLRPADSQVVTAGLATVRIGGAVVGRDSFACPSDPQEALSLVADRISQAIVDSGRHCLGIGVALPGMLSPDLRVLRQALHLGWRDVPAAELITDRLARRLAAAGRSAVVPVRLGNDAVLAALGECRRGAGRTDCNTLVLFCDRLGIGGALMSQGRPHAGMEHALEPGHLVIDPAGPRCGCGQRGCLELFTDGRTLPEAVLRAAADGEPAARAAVGAGAGRVGAALATLVNILGPDQVVLTGLLGQIFTLASDSIRAQLRGALLARAYDTDTVPGALASPAIVGAAEYAFESFFAAPRMADEPSAVHSE